MFASVPKCSAAWEICLPNEMRNTRRAMDPMQRNKELAMSRNMEVFSNDVHNMYVCSQIIRIVERLDGHGPYILYSAGF